MNAIRNGMYREAVFETKSPMDVGLCTYEELEKVLNKNRKKKSKNKHFIQSSCSNFYK